MTEDNKQDTSFPSGGSRTEYIGAKVTVEQKQYIRRLAAECGMTVSSYVLARAFNYRPKARLTARQEAVMETLIGCRSDLVNYTSALRGMNPEKRRQMFNSYPFMLEWLKELGRLAERVTDVLDKVRFSNRLPDGIRAMLYVSGESRNKKHPERIFHVGDNLLPPGLDATGIWDSMRLTLEKSKRVKNSVIRIEVSPAPEHTKDFTIDDWQRLWDDFTDEFDNIELLDKNGKTYSPKTALKGSKGTVWLHLESKSGIPHLHGAFCRIDERGNINNDHDIHLRAQRAAERVALKRGWTTAAEVRETNIGQVNRDCMETLQSMESWSWDEYVARLRSKGYEFWELRDNKKILRGYVLKKGNARYKASELGRGRNLMATKLESTWKKLHAAPKTRTVSTQPAAGKSIPTTPRTIPVHAQGTTPVPQYTGYRPGTSPYHIDIDGESRRFFIPDEALDVFNDEFDYRETANSRDLTDMAAALFVGMLDTPAVPSGGGGGSSNDLPWGRREDEDEREWARRCAREAARVIGKKPKTGRKR